MPGVEKEISFSSTNIVNPSQARVVTQGLPPINRSQECWVARNLRYRGNRIAADGAILGYVPKVLAQTKGASLGLWKAARSNGLRGLVNVRALNSEMRTGAKTVAAGVKGAGRFAGVTRIGGGALLGVGSVVEAVQVYDQERHEGISTAKAVTHGVGAGVGTFGGALLGAKGGAIIGTFICPGIGTGIGVLAGGIIGGIAGSSIGRSVASWFTDGGVVKCAKSCWRGVCGLGNFVRRLALGSEGVHNAN